MHTQKKECAIHCTTDTSELVSPRDLDSWRTLARAAEIKGHAGENTNENISTEFR